MSLCVVGHDVDRIFVEIECGISFCLSLVLAMLTEVIHKCQGRIPGKDYLDSVSGETGS